jgi:hypothetical protein
MKPVDDTFNIDSPSILKKNADISEITINIDKYCRICFEQDENIYISPCLCTGSMEFVHEDCLKNWILGKYTQFNSAKCEVCKQSFNLATVKKFTCKRYLSNSEWVSFGYRLILYLIILTILAIVSFLSFSRFLDFRKAMGQSIAILCVFSFFILVNLIIILRLILTAFIKKKVVSIKIKSKSK